MGKPAAAGKALVDKVVEISQSKPAPRAPLELYQTLRPDQKHVVDWLIRDLAGEDEG